MVLMVRPRTVTPRRGDDPEAVNLHAGRYAGAKALVVLGGLSSARWQQVREDIKPDVLISANGGNSIVPDLDYWLCAENMSYTQMRATQGFEDAIKIMEMFHREAGAKTKLVSWHSWRFLADTSRCVKIRRQGYDLDEIPTDFSFRKYGMGYLAGGISKYPDAWQTNVQVCVGTVALQLLHHAGLIGCSEVHTIGFDLMFGDGDRHHAYDYPAYKADRYRTEAMFIEHKGIRTMRHWLETAEYIKAIEPLFKRDGIVWKDHSNGLLKIEGLDCAL